MKKIVIFSIIACVAAVVLGVFVWSDWGINARRLWALRDVAPEFRAPLVVSDLMLPSAAVRQLQDQAATAAKQLDADWSSFDDWMQLAVVRKIAGDFQGAAEAWEFAHKLQPQNLLPLHNLGNLYAYELQDSSRAEGYYLRALPFGRNDVQLYRSIYEFYRFIKKDDTTAKQYLEEGIANNLLNSEDLQALVDSF